MTDFALYQRALTQYKESVTTEDNEDSTEEMCDHIEVVENNGHITCLDCGEQIKKVISQDKEWRYYGNGDGKKSSDPSRAQARKVEDKSILKDVEQMGFSSRIVSDANELYAKVTNGHIYRGSTRKAIIFACVYQAYKFNHNPQTHENLMNIFSLTKKSALQGIKHVSLHAPKDCRIHTIHITPINLIEDIMKKFNASDTHKEEVCNLYGKIKNRSSKLNRSRPQSVASGLVYYWILTKKLPITLSDFAQKVELSQMTIQKISSEIECVLKK